MKRPQQETGPVGEALESAKMEFIAEWRRGGQPTVQKYIVRYPAFAEELTEFILTFVEMERTAAEGVEELETTSLLERAITRANAVNAETPPTLMALAKTAGKTMLDLEEMIPLPGQALMEIMRGQLLDCNRKLVRYFANALQCGQTEMQVALLAPVSPQAIVSSNYRATGEGRLTVSPLPRKSFRQILEECPELTPEQREWWLKEEE